MLQTPPGLSRAFVSPPGTPGLETGAPSGPYGACQDVTSHLLVLTRSDMKLRDTSRLAATRNDTERLFFMKHLVTSHGSPSLAFPFILSQHI